MCSHCAAGCEGCSRQGMGLLASGACAVGGERAAALAASWPHARGVRVRRPQQESCRGRCTCPHVNGVACSPRGPACAGVRGRLGSCRERAPLTALRGSCRSCGRRVTRGQAANCRETCFRKPWLQSASCRRRTGARSALKCVANTLGRAAEGKALPSCSCDAADRPTPGRALCLREPPVQRGVPCKETWCACHAGPGRPAGTGATLDRRSTPPPPVDPPPDPTKGRQAGRGL
jgi:hypothetical protein